MTLDKPFLLYFIKRNATAKMCSKLKLHFFFNACPSN